MRNLPFETVVSHPCGDIVAAADCIITGQAMGKTEIITLSYLVNRIIVNHNLSKFALDLSPIPRLVTKEDPKERIFRRFVSKLKREA